MDNWIKALRQHPPPIVMKHKDTQEQQETKEKTDFWLAMNLILQLRGAGASSRRIVEAVAAFSNGSVEWLPRFDDQLADYIGRHRSALPKDRRKYYEWIAGVEFAIVDVIEGKRGYKKNEPHKYRAVINTITTRFQAALYKAGYKTLPKRLPKNEKDREKLETIFQSVLYGIEPPFIKRNPEQLKKDLEEEYTEKHPARIKRDHIVNEASKIFQLMKKKASKDEIEAFEDRFKQIIMDCLKDFGVGGFPDK